MCAGRGVCRGRGERGGRAPVGVWREGWAGRREAPTPSRKERASRYIIYEAMAQTVMPTTRPTNRRRNAVSGPSHSETHSTHANREEAGMVTTVAVSVRASIRWRYVGDWLCEEVAIMGGVAVSRFFEPSPLSPQGRSSHGTRSRGFRSSELCTPLLVVSLILSLSLLRRQRLGVETVTS